MVKVVEGLRLAILAVAVGLVSCGGGGAAPTLVAPSLTLTPQGIKSFHFEWTDAGNETQYRLLESADGRSPYTQVATLPADAT